MGGRNPSSITEVGLYSISYASKLVDVRRQTIERLLFGSALPTYDGRYAASFLDLMELRVIRQFLELGVTLQMVLRVAEKARDLLQTDYPFATRLFKTEGRTILADFQLEAPDALLEVIHDQWVFEQVIGPSLHDLDYPDEDQTTSPYLWWPAGRDSQVIVNPRVSFGMPVARDRWVPTRMLANQARVNGVQTTARLYDVTEQAVADALDFEERLAA